MHEKLMKLILSKFEQKYEYEEIHLTKLGTDCKDENTFLMHPFSRKDHANRSIGVRRKTQ